MENYLGSFNMLGGTGQTVPQQFQMMQPLGQPPMMTMQQMGQPSMMQTLGQPMMQQIPQMNMQSIPQMNMQQIPQMNMPSIPQMNMQQIPQMNMQQIGQPTMPQIPQMNMQQIGQLPMMQQVPQMNMPQVPPMMQFQVPQIGAGQLSQPMTVQPPEQPELPALEETYFQVQPQGIQPAARVSSRPTRSHRDIPTQVAPPSGFYELDLWPIRCYGCGEVLLKEEVEQSLSSGKPLKQTLDELGYARICCRTIIKGQPSLVKLQKQLGNSNNIAQQLQNLTLAKTAGQAVPFSVRPNMPQSSIRIVDEAPPGLQPSGICLGGMEEAFTEDLTQTGDAFDYFMNKLGVNSEVYMGGEESGEEDE